MTDPINPNTLVPMSLEVKRIAELRKVNPSNNQKILSQLKNQKDKKKSKSVNKNEKSENLIINDDGNNSNKRQKNDEEEENDENKTKGTVIDIKV